jgi:hypothetical protein
MITNARPSENRGSHFYTKTGEACYEVPKAKGGGTRKTHVGDCRKLGLLPSPTNILSLLAKPQLVNWQVEQGCLAVLTSPRRPDESIDDFVYRVLHVDQEHNQERDLAADEGTNIHNAIQLSLEGLEYDPKYRPHVEAVRREIDPLGYVVMTEKVVVGEGYAGRTDAVLENPEMITVLDFKGCNKLPDKPYDEHRMQMAAYSAALGNTGEKRVQCANVYINRNVPGEVKLCVIDDWQKEYEKFKLLVRYWYLANNVPMPEGML